MRRIQDFTCVIGVVAALLWTGGAAADDWPGFQGPNGNCVSNETGLMKTWPQGGPEVLWTVDVGIGFGGVAIDDGEVYLLDRVTGAKDVLRCLALDSGDELWRFSYDASGRISYPGSRSHPTVDDEYVYIVGPFGDLNCVSRQTHKSVWTHNILKEFERKIPHWAMSQAPSLYKDMVIVAPAGRKAGVVAFERTTGRTVWTSAPLKGDISYASPIVTTIAGVDQVLVVTTTHLTAVDANTGEVLWSTDAFQCRIPIASAAPMGDGRVFVSGGYGAGTAMFRITKDGDRFACQTLFKTDESNGQIHQPILYENHICVNGNDKGKRDGLVCMGLDGDVKWKTGRSPGFDWGGMLLADGMLYVVDGNKGDLCMVRPDPSRYREVARVNLLSGSKIWATIALSDGKLILRDQNQMKCVDVRGL